MHSGIILADGILFFEVEKFDNLQRCITKLNTFEIFWDYSRRMKCVPDVKFWTWLFVKDNLPQPTQLASSKSNYHPVDEIIAYQSEKLFYKWFILNTPWFSFLSILSFFCDSHLYSTEKHHSFNIAFDL